MSSDKNALGTLENMSAQQAEVLRRLKQHLEESGIHNRLFDDRYLLRFCRARKFDYPKVELMWDNHMKWRQENNVGEIAKLDTTPATRLYDLIQYGYCCVDKEGRPVYVERYKNFDLKEIYDRVSKEYLLQYYTYQYERLIALIMPYLTRKYNHGVIERSVTILDLDGLNTMKIISKKAEIQSFLKVSTSIAQDNYPETMAKLYIINAPFIFSMLWGMAKGFLDENTTKKISILGSGFKKELLKSIDEDQLPDFLGGKNKKPLNQSEFDDLFRNAEKYQTFDLDEIEKKQKEEMLMSEGNLPQLKHSISGNSHRIKSYHSGVINRSNYSESMLQLDDDLFDEFPSLDQPQTAPQSAKLYGNAVDTNQI